MMRLSLCSKATTARRLYWCLGISSFLLVAAIIGIHKPTDLRFRAIPRLKTHHESMRLKTNQSTGPRFESKVAETRSLPITVNHLEWNATEIQSSLRTVSYPDWNASLSEYTAFGLYILLDNASLESGNAESQWDSLNHSVSSTCDAVDKLHVQILIDRKGGQRADIRQFITRYFETTATICEEFGTSTELRTVEVGSVRQSARRLTQLMTNDYVVERIEYFSVVFIPNTDYRGFPDQLQLLLDRSSDGVGFVADYARNSTLPSSLFFGKVHGEIFGWFLPPFLSDIKLALTYTIHLYPANLWTITTRNESTVNSRLKGMNDPKSFGFSAAGISALELDRDTLRRYLSVSRASDTCFRCPNNTSRKIIAMSLYGKNSRYTMGAIRNAQLLPITFPGWRLRVYVERQLPGRRPYSYGQVPPTVLAKLVELGAEVRYVDVTRTGLAPMLWRFTVAEDPDVDVFIVRDCDSRLTPRDAAVVADWLRTGKVFHCVRDHPSHSRYPVSGGLWGARRKPFMTIFGQEGRLSGVMRRYGSGYVQDMNFLGREVWPRVKQVAYCHDSYSCQRYPASHPFPVARVGAEHLGQVYDEFSIGRKSDMDTVLRTPVNTKCVVVVAPPKGNNSVLP